MTLEWVGGVGCYCICNTREGLVVQFREIGSKETYDLGSSICYACEFDPVWDSEHVKDAERVKEPRRPT